MHAKGKGIAKEDIDGKPHGLPHTPLMVVEGEILVGKEADDAGDGIIGRRGHPIAAAQQVVHPEHDAHAQDGVGGAMAAKRSSFRSTR